MQPSILIRFSVGCYRSDDKPEDRSRVSIALREAAIVKTFSAELPLLAQSGGRVIHGIGLWAGELEPCLFLETVQLLSSSQSSLDLARQVEYLRSWSTRTAQRLAVAAVQDVVLVEILESDSRLAQLVSKPDAEAAQ